MSSHPLRAHAFDRRELLLLLATSLLLSGLYAIEIWGFDDWWHLATGRWIVENGSIPQTDPFSFTARGQRWPALPWLGELGFYGAYRLAGVAGMVLCQVVCAFGTLSMVGLTLREVGVGRWMGIAQVVLVAVIVQERYARARPETFGAVLLALSIYLMVRWWKRADRSLLWLGLVTLVWIPTHGSAVLGFAMAGAVGVAGWLSPVRERRWVPFAAAALSLLGFAVTRTGREVLDLALRASREASPVALSITEEWRAPTLADGSIWLPTVVGVAALAYAASRRRELLVPAALSLLGLVLMARSIRHIAPCVLLCSPLWGIAAHALASHVRARGLGLVAGSLPWIVGLGLAFAHLAFAPFENNRIAFGFGIVERRYPVDTVPLLRMLPEGHTVHDMHLGGYLIWHRVPVFWDGRTVGLYTDRQIAEVFLPAEQDEAALEGVSDRYGVRYGLVTFDGPLGVTMMTSNEWIPVCYGDASTLFVRRRYAEGVVRAGLPLLTTLRISPSQAWNDHWYGRVLADPVGTADLVASIRSQLERNPDGVTFLAALAYLRERQERFYRTLPARLGGDVTLPVL